MAAKAAPVTRKGGRIRAMRRTVAGGMFLSARVMKMPTMLMIRPTVASAMGKRDRDGADLVLARGCPRGERSPRMSIGMVRPRAMVATIAAM